MRIGYILDKFPVLSETFISDEIYSLVDRGIEVHIFSLNRPDSNQFHPRAAELLRTITVHYSSRLSRAKKLTLLANNARHAPLRTLTRISQLSRDRTNLWFATDALLISHLARRLGLDVLHAHFTKEATQTAYQASLWSGIPFTFTIHGPAEIFEVPPPNLRQLADASAEMICISEFNRQYIYRTFGVPLKKMPIIRCGIYTDFFHVSPRRSFPHNGGTRILTVARLSPQKGHKFLLQALSQLLRRGLTFHLKLVGEGPLRNELEDLCDELGISEHVEFCGSKTHDQIQELYHWSDLCVLPSIAEGLAIVNMEAMLSGRPTIATNVTGASELIEDGVTGFLCPPGDPDALGETIVRVLEQWNQLDPVLEAAHERVCTEFSRRASTESLMTHWQDAISKAD